MLTHPVLSRARRHAAWRRLLAVLPIAAVLAACDIGVTDPSVDRNVLTPTSVITSARFTQLAAGFFHTCGITAAGETLCWGSNQWSQLGTTAILPGCPIGTCSFVPVTSGDNLVFRQLAGGTSHTCGIATNNRTYCWGATSSPTGPLLGDGGTIRSTTPILVRTDSLFTQVTAGGAHACGITANGIALCWGRNEFGQLGDSSTNNGGLPVRVIGDQRFTSISAGSDFTCGLATTGVIYCWGSNAFGQLGTGDVTFNVPRTTLKPTAIAGTWTAVAAGGSHACALDAAGRVSCWGRNDNAGQLGDSSLVTHSGTPGPIRSTLTFQSLQAGAGTTCARTAGGDLWCWGGNAFGNVGNGRVVNGGEPVPVKAQGGPYSAYALGASHTCAIDATGDTRCWGDRLYGQTGSR